VGRQTTEAPRVGTGVERNGGLIPSTQKLGVGRCQQQPKPIGALAVKQRGGGRRRIPHGLQQVPKRGRVGTPGSYLVPTPHIH
jgi:hypothetical protein